MNKSIQNSLRLRSLLCGAATVAVLSALAVSSGCNSNGAGSTGMNDSDSKKFSTRVDPNNPPPEAVAAMAKMRASAKGAPQNPSTPISTPPPK